MKRIGKWLFKSVYSRIDIMVLLPIVFISIGDKQWFWLLLFILWCAILWLIEKKLEDYHANKGTDRSDN